MSKAILPLSCIYKAFLGVELKMRENAAFCGALLAISTAHAMSDFWAQSRNTSKLSSLRMGAKVTHPSMTKDDLVNNPLFMPLCGNGRIDKKEDYIEYGATLSMSKARLLAELPSLDGPMYNISIIADEECDDGNRLDFDGCSADCMYTDCMTSACELAVDLSLEYEDLIYDNVRGKMVVSALNGIYSLEIGPSETTMRAVIIASKNFKAVSIFRHTMYLVLYDPVSQSLWGVADGSNKLTILNKLDMLVGWNSSDGEWPAIVSKPNGPIVIRDGTDMIYLKTPTSAVTTSDRCYGGVEMASRKCDFIMENGGSLVIGCEVGRIIIGENTCIVDFESHRAQDMMDGTIWGDIFNSAVARLSTWKTVQKAYYGLPDDFPLNDRARAIIMSVEGYNHIGGFFEMTVNPPRKLMSPDTMPLVYSLGDPSMASMLITTVASGPATCGDEMCLFDNDPAYDITEDNPMKYARGDTWNRIIQDLISGQNSSIFSLKSDEARYKTFIDGVANNMESMSSPRAVIAVAKHPVTHSLWAIRKDKLVEVSKSGVKVKRPDGKCIPSDVALCGKCTWASSGTMCMPCAAGNASSLAWSLSCRQCTNARRRMLQVHNDAIISFTMMGDLTKAREIWPKATASDGGIISVSVATSDQPMDMRTIKTQLLLHAKKFRVIIPPYVEMSLEDTSYENDNTIDSKFMILIGCAASFALCGLMFCIIRGKNVPQNQRNDPSKKPLLSS